MCFVFDAKPYLSNEGNIVPSIAEEDIFVYKIIRINGLGICYNLKDKEGNIIYWKIGTHAKSRIVLPTKLFYGVIHFYGVINEGLHSCKYMSEALEYFNYHFNNNSTLGIVKITKMVIPKGAEYFENQIEYVSNELIYIEDVPPPIS